MESLGGPDMISIEGLNRKQMAMMDIIWSCASEEQFMLWFISLPVRDQKTVESLLELLKQEYLEMILRTNEMTESKELLQRIKTK
jgi:hypothetical protein